MRLRAAPAPASAAQALTIVGRVAANCPVGAVDAVRAAERAVRDVVVLRCCRTTAPRDRDAFLAAAEEAFGGGGLELQLHSQLLLAYKKVMGSAAEAFPSNTAVSAARRGAPRPRRRRSPPPREEAQAAAPGRSATPVWDRNPMWLRVQQEPQRTRGDGLPLPPAPTAQQRAL